MVNSYCLILFESIKNTFVLAIVENPVPVIVKVDFKIGLEDDFDNNDIDGTNVGSYVKPVIV